MTQQEAEVFAVKLTRIWVPNAAPKDYFSGNFDPGFFTGGGAWVTGILTPTTKPGEPYVEFEFSESKLGFKNQFEIRQILPSLKKHHRSIRKGWLMCAIGHSPQSGPILPPHLTPAGCVSGTHEQFAAFAAEWLPFFRRNCYLSGANIECTEHEKLEWSLWLREREEAERLAPLPL